MIAACAPSRSAIWRCSCPIVRCWLLDHSQQHRVDLVVVDRFDLAAGRVRHQFRSRLGHFFGDQPELQRSVRSVSRVTELDRMQVHDRLGRVPHIADVALHPPRRTHRTELSHGVDHHRIASAVRWSHRGFPHPCHGLFASPIFDHVCVRGRARIANDNVVITRSDGVACLPANNDVVLAAREENAGAGASAVLSYPVVALSAVLPIAVFWNPEILL